MTRRSHPRSFVRAGRVQLLILSAADSTFPPCQRHPPPPRVHQGRQHPLPRRGGRLYDAKWGIDFGESARIRWRRRCARRSGGGPEAFGDALEIGAGTGYFGLNLLQLGLVRAADRDRHLARDARRPSTQPPSASACASRPSRADAEALPFADASFDLVFGHAVLHHIPDLTAPREFHGCCDPAAPSRSAASPLATETRSRPLPKRGALLAAPLWRRLVGRRRARPGARSARRRQPRPRERGRRPRVLAGRLQRLFAGAGFGGSGSVARSCWRTCMAGWCAHSSPPRNPTGPVRLAHFAFRSYLALQRVDRVPARAPPAIRSSSTTWSCGDQGLGRISRR